MHTYVCQMYSWCLVSDQDQAVVDLPLGIYHVETRLNFHAGVYCWMIITRVQTFH